MSRQSRNAGDVLLPVDVEKFDAAWKLDGDFYVPPGGEGVPGRRERFERFYGRLQAVEGTLEAPEVAVNDAGKVSFINGRHRFSVQRDQGIRPIYVAFTSGSVANAKKFNLVTV
jgi:hypothetical protein